MLVPTELLTFEQKKEENKKQFKLNKNFKRI